VVNPEVSGLQLWGLVLQEGLLKKYKVLELKILVKEKVCSFGAVKRGDFKGMDTAFSSLPGGETRMDIFKIGNPTQRRKQTFRLTIEI